MDFAVVKRSLRCVDKSFWGSTFIYDSGLVYAISREAASGPRWIPMMSARSTSINKTSFLIEILRLLKVTKLVPCMEHSSMSRNIKESGILVPMGFKVWRRLHACGACFRQRYAVVSSNRLSSIEDQNTLETFSRKSGEATWMWGYLWFPHTSQ